MKLYMKQKVFSWNDKFRIWDAQGNVRLLAEGELFTLGKKLHLMTPDGRELAFIHQKVWSFLPRYYVSVDGEDIAEVVKQINIFHSEYDVVGPDWKVEGDFMAHEYTISFDGMPVAAVHKQWFTFGDSYEIEVFDPGDEVLAVCVVLIIDAVVASEGAAAASATMN